MEITTAIPRYPIRYNLSKCHPFIYVSETFRDLREIKRVSISLYGIFELLLQIIKSVRICATSTRNFRQASTGAKCTYKRIIAIGPFNAGAKEA